MSFPRSFIAFLVLALAVASHASDTNIDKRGLALEGYDPVSYFKESSPRKGNKSITYQSEGITYRFETDANRAAFENDAAKYTPAYGGWCAWAMLEGEKVEVDPLAYRVYEGRLMLFYKGIWGDTLKQWKKKAAKDSEASLVSQADQQWSKH